MDINNLTSDIITYINLPGFQRNLLIFKIFSAILSLFFLFFIIYFLYKTKYLRIHFWQDLVEFFTYRPYELKKFTRNWKRITKRLETTSESEYKLAIIEADNLLNKILARMGYKGEGLENKLKQVTEIVIPNLDSLAKAHKLRNDIIYNPDYRLTFDQTKKILDIYEETFRNLQIF